MFKTVDELGAEQRLLMRVDLNSPIDDGVAQDNSRFEHHAETITRLLNDDHRLALLAHQGRPGGDSFVSLRSHADVLSTYLDNDVAFVPDTYGEQAIGAIQRLGVGEVVLLENTRMTPDELPEKSAEEHADSEFVQTLAPEFDAFVNDAYSVAHRAHASTVGFPPVMPAYAGPVMAAEYEHNTQIAEREFDGPVSMLVGGTKATDVIGVMHALGDKVDSFYMGGIAGELFLRGAGYPVGYDVDGTDLFDDQWAENRTTIESLLEEYGEQIELPRDLAYEDADGNRAEIAVDAIDEKTTSYLDIGSQTVADYSAGIKGSDAVFVKGALGLFEDERFSIGTVGILETIAGLDCFSVIGGGDTSRAVDLYDLDRSAFSHVSIAGGAYLGALTGDPLPAIEALELAAARCQ
ncbi:MAG: phosphoglycerate kinase [Halobacteriales archaeon]